MHLFSSSSKSIRIPQSAHHGRIKSSKTGDGERCDAALGYNIFSSAVMGPQCLHEGAWIWWWWICPIVSPIWFSLTILIVCFTFSYVWWSWIMKQCVSDLPCSSRFSLVFFALYLHWVSNSILLFLDGSRLTIHSGSIWSWTTFKDPRSWRYREIPAGTCFWSIDRNSYRETDLSLIARFRHLDRIYLRFHHHQGLFFTILPPHIPWKEGTSRVLWLHSISDLSVYRGNSSRHIPVLSSPEGLG